MYIILVYDISINRNGEKRLHKIFNLCKKYLHHIQNSVFEGEITESNLEKMKIEISKIINKNFDSVIIFKSGNNKWLNKELLGNQEDKTDNFI